MTPEQVVQQDLKRCVDDLLRARRSVRAYRSEAVSRRQVHEILDAAATAPSNSNTQPWRVHVVTGEPKKRLSDALVTAFRENTLPPSPHFPDRLPEAVAARQDQFAGLYYGTLGIERGDAAARARQTLRNFSFFGAPVGLLFSIHGGLRPHSWLDLGLFIQNVMIAAMARGIATCPQVSFARFHQVIAAHLPMQPEEITACGMSMGYADLEAPINAMAVQRVAAGDFARFVGFED